MTERRKEIFVILKKVKKLPPKPPLNLDYNIFSCDFG
jgi:hypothetical protein